MVSTNDINKLNSYAQEHIRLRDKWLAHILQISVVLFGLLLSFYKPADNVDMRQKVLASSIALLGLGILFLSIALYASVSNAKHQFYNYKELLQSNLPIVVSNEPKVFSVLRTIAYIFLLISLIGFVSFMFSFVFI